MRVNSKFRVRGAKLLGATENDIRSALWCWPTKFKRALVRGSPNAECLASIFKPRDDKLFFVDLFCLLMEN